MPQSGLPNLPGTATGRAAGLAAHEVRFGAAADTPLNARRASQAVSKVRRGSASNGMTSFLPPAARPCCGSRLDLVEYFRCWEAGGGSREGSVPGHTLSRGG